MRILLEMTIGTKENAPLPSAKAIEGRVGTPLEGHGNRRPREVMGSPPMETMIATGKEIEVLGIREIRLLLEEGEISQVSLRTDARRRICLVLLDQAEAAAVLVEEEEGVAMGDLATVASLT